MILISCFSSSFNATIHHSSHLDILSNNNQNEKIETIIRNVDQQKVESYLSDLYTITSKYGDRMTSSEGAKQSAEFIKQSFSNMSDRLDISENSWYAFGECYRSGFYHDKNIIAELPGHMPNCSTFVFFVHYDTIEDSLGADDDGSGVAALLTCAEILSEFHFNHTILFCASSGEEVGDLGDYDQAELFYEKQRDIAAAITADGIGYMPDVDNKNQNSVVLYKPERSQWISDIVLDVYQTYEHIIDLDQVRLGGFFGNSGNRAYDNYGYSTLKFFEGITNPGWENAPHTNDTIEYINFSYLTQVTKLIAGSIATLANMPSIYPKISISSPEEDSLYLNGRKVSFLPLNKGKTICIGNNVLVKPEISIDQVESIKEVIFEIYLGENDIKSFEERKRVAIHNDSLYPFEVRFTEPLWGWHTIRTTVITNNTSNCDEIEVFFIG